MKTKKYIVPTIEMININLDIITESHPEAISCPANTCYLDGNFDCGSYNAE